MAEGRIHHHSQLPLQNCYLHGQKKCRARVVPRKIQHFRAIHQRHPIQGVGWVALGEMRVAAVHWQTAFLSFRACHGLEEPLLLGQQFEPKQNWASSETKKCPACRRLSGASDLFALLKPYCTLLSFPLRPRDLTDSPVEGTRHCVRKREQK